MKTLEEIKLNNLNRVSLIPEISVTLKIFVRANTVAHSTGFGTFRKDRKTCVKLVYPKSQL